MSEECIEWIKMFYHNAKSPVHCSIGATKNFMMKVGVHQDAVLSTLLFTTVVNATTRDG